MTTSLLKGRRFCCREWAFGKVNHCLENRATAKTCGALIMGGPGCGKTALCCELIWPTTGSTGKQQQLSRKALAFYFCQAHDIETLSITHFIHCLVDQISKSSLVGGYEQQLADPAVQAALDPTQCEQNPDEALKRGVLLPLGAVEPPEHSLFIMVDSVDESYLQSTGEKGKGSRTIAELLAKHHSLFPPWLLLICTARKQSKSVTRLFTGFRKIALDDLRKSHVVHDVQQYILRRLDQEEELCQHLSRETAEMLNQLHIKSNGCFLYLERVLDGVANSFILLREIREIPGTLNGLYLWLCQRLFVRKQFAKVQPLLNVILAARRPLTEMELYSCAYTRNVNLTLEEFRRRMQLLSKVLQEGKDGTKILFHHSFAEWLLDVKHCTQKYLCTAAEGHGMLAMSFTMHAPSLTAVEIQDFALHLARSSLQPPIEHHHLALWMLQSGACVEDSLLPDPPKDPAVLRLLLRAGASLPDPSQVAASTSSKLSLCESDDRSEDSLSRLLDRGGAINDLDSNGRTLLCNAAYNGDLHTVQMLIGRGADLEIVDKSGHSALNLASRQGHCAVVDALLKAKAKTDHTDADGWTALRSAAWGGHTKVVQRLLEWDAEVDQSDADGRTALRAAAWGGHDDIVALLLQHGAKVNKTDNEGRSALIAASYMGHRDICVQLLTNGAAVNHEDIDGRTALSVAALCVPASEGHADVVSLLLESAAEVDHQDHDGMTPLLVAAYEGHQDVCELLLEYDADVDHWDQNNRTPLQAAASMGHAAVINQLLFWGAAVDTIDNDGRTVLCIAAQQGNVEVVRQLLDRGLDEMHRDNAGWTPLHMAAFEGHKQIVEVLLECGSRQTEVDNEGRIPLLLAAQEGHLSCVEALLQAGSPLEARAHDGKTSFRMAALEGHKDLVHFLLMRQADTEYKDADGRSTLYVLALENHVEMAVVLLENGVKTESPDLEGRTPLHVAAWQGHHQMADVLLRHGAQSNAEDNDKRTPLQSAAWQGHANIVRLLLEHGAEVDHACNQGATALCIASQEGHEQVVKVLLQFKADPNHADQYGRTATRVALKGGHKKVVKILEEFGAFKCSRVSNSSNYANVPATATIAKPASASQALASAMAIANGNVNGSASSASPASTGHRQNGVQSKSSNSMTASSTNSTADPSGLQMTFTQQLQQCSLGKNRGKAPTKVLSPVSEPESPASVPGSPTDDHPIRIISNPREQQGDLQEEEPVWQKQSDQAVNKPSAGPMAAGIAMGQGALNLKSPESRRKRNGIVTNPNFSLNNKASVNINGYYNKLSEEGFPAAASSKAASSPSPVPSPSPSSTPSHPATPSSAAVKAKKAPRPNGLPLKKETPL